MNAERMTCVRNGGYPASLELNKVYESLPDDAAEEHGLLRIVDESGEDYLYPKSYFNPAGPSQPAQQSNMAAEHGKGQVISAAMNTTSPGAAKTPNES